MGLLDPDYGAPSLNSRRSPVPWSFTYRARPSSAL
jgi:hypothetical protein